MPESSQSPRVHACPPAVPLVLTETPAGTTWEFLPVLVPSIPEPLSTSGAWALAGLLLGRKWTETTGAAVLRPPHLRSDASDLRSLQPSSPTSPPSPVPVSFACSTNRLAQADSPFSSGPGAWLVAGDVLVLSWKIKIRTLAVRGETEVPSRDAASSLSRPTPGCTPDVVFEEVGLEIREGGREVPELIHQVLPGTRASAEGKTETGPRGVCSPSAPTQTRQKEHCGKCCSHRTGPSSQFSTRRDTGQEAAGRRCL